MSKITHALLLEASTPGGPSCLTSVTDLEPAAGPHSSVAPAKFASPNRADRKGQYAYEPRFLNGQRRKAVIIDSKQSQLNRCEAALQQAIIDGHRALARLPRVVVWYERNGSMEEFSDLTLPHRIFDGHIRAGTVDDQPVTQLASYRSVRDATPANARALLDTSPVSLAFGCWDSSRSARQGRWRSALVGEIIGFCGDDGAPTRGGARVDPVGMKIELSAADLKALADRQRGELSAKTYDKTVKEATEEGRKGRRVEVKASTFGLGGVPPTLDTLSGVACDPIIRSHVLSFAALRQMRFGAGAEGDASCRALLAALALNALSRSDSELYLRANCDLRERGPARVAIDQRGRDPLALEPLSVADADALLDAALAHAQDVAGIAWNGVVMRVKGDPAIVAGALASEDAGDS